MIYGSEPNGSSLKKKASTRMFCDVIDGKCKSLVAGKKGVVLTGRLHEHGVRANGICQKIN